MTKTAESTVKLQLQTPLVKKKKKLMNTWQYNNNKYHINFLEAYSWINE